MKIESNIPIPPKYQSMRCDMTKDMAGMKPGDSFLWDGHPQMPYRAALRLGIEITTRKVSGKGMRVWRTK